MGLGTDVTSTITRDPAIREASSGLWILNPCGAGLWISAFSAVSADCRCSHDHERTKDARTGDEVPNDGHTDCPP